ncbi:MAG: hypothetical protein S4CHLAM6_09190 [Chlamydiae bacterium]|nr:hypothetical protein [Chlamydiota bacterium]
MDSILQQSFEEHLGIFLFALFLSVLVCFIAWYRSYFKLPSFDSSRLKVELIHVIGAFAIYFLVAMAVTIITYFILSSTSAEHKEHMVEQINAVRAWVNLAVMSFVFVVLIGYLRYLNSTIVKTVLGEDSYKGIAAIIQNFGMGMLSVLISFPLVIAVGQLANIVLALIHKQSQQQVAVKFLQSTFNNPVAYIFSCIFVILIIPAIEEILFRGFLQNWIAKYTGQIGAIFSSALIFALFHFSMKQGWGNLEIIPSLFVLACFLGFIYFRQKSIYASIGLHATYNGINVLFMSLASGGSS